MTREIVIVYDTPSITHSQLISTQYLKYFLNFFNRIQVLYWSKDNFSNPFKIEGGRFIFYPYCKPYDSGYITGLKYMVWIGKTLWKISKNLKDSKLLFMTVTPIWAGLPTLIVGKMRRKKVILRLDVQRIDYTEKENKLNGFSKIHSFLRLLTLKIIFSFTLPLYDFVIGISKGVSQEAKKYGAKKITTIPFLIDINPFLAEGKKKTKKPIILYVGQIKKMKGIDILIEAFRLLKTENFLAKLLIVGSPTNPKDELYYKEIKLLSRGLDVEFLGWFPHEKLPEIYQQADIFVLPSYSEALGVVIMEAMASGLPVIATETSGGKELIDDGKTGFLVSIGNPIAIKEKIKILLEKPGLRESMGSAGRKKIKELMKRVKKDTKKFWESLELSSI